MSGAIYDNIVRTTKVKILFTRTINMKVKTMRNMMRRGRKGTLLLNDVPWLSIRRHRRSQRALLYVEYADKINDSEVRVALFVRKTLIMRGSRKERPCSGTNDIIFLTMKFMWSSDNVNDISEKMNNIPGKIASMVWRVIAEARMFMKLKSRLFHICISVRRKDTSLN